VKHPILILLAFLGLATPALAQRPRPTVGEEQYDERGNLIWSKRVKPSMASIPTHDLHGRPIPEHERKALFFFFFGPRNRQQQQQQQTDPNVLNALNQLQANHQRMVELLSAMQAQLAAQLNRQVQAPAPQQPIVLLLGGSQPHQQLQPSPQPLQQLQPQPQPKQDLQPQPLPKQDLQPSPQPKQDLQPGPIPKQDLQPGGGKAAPAPAQGKPLGIPDPGTAKPLGPPTGYQIYSGRTSSIRVWEPPSRR
jgi:hypothetical protein